MLICQEGVATHEVGAAAKLLAQHHTGNEGGEDGEQERDKPPARTRRTGGMREWAWVELNYRPHAYQACALTT